MPLQMTPLSARIAAATEGSRELDIAILHAAGWEPMRRNRWKLPDERFVSDGDLTRPTSDLSSIVALIEAQGLYIARIERQLASGDYYAAMQKDDVAPNDCPFTTSSHSSIILALCEAFAKALEAERHE